MTQRDQEDNDVTQYSYVDDFLKIRDEMAPSHGWTHRREEVWCYVLPPGRHFGAQGWKIHLSATPRSASDVLAAASRVLLERQIPFKFAHGLRQLRMLLSIRMDRGSGGKFMTVYPPPESFAGLLEALHEATAGCEGPAILSDRRYRPDSVVHYRYGGFSGHQRVLDTDGSYVPMLVAPDGGWTPDERNAWYSPPPWAPAPPGTAAPDVHRNTPGTREKRGAEAHGTAGGAQGILLNDRFLVYEAIRHSNRGGVYRARDRHDNDRKVIVKEARPFVAAETDGTDARDYLRNEYLTLGTLHPLGVAVRPIDYFVYQGHSFLAEEEVPGATLRDWVHQRVTATPSRALPLGTVLPLARRVVELARAVHDRGLVLRDYTPNNIMVTADDELVLIDTEFAARPGETVTRVQTMSYTAPEELTGPVRYPAPGREADVYSVGATLFYLCAGIHPLLAADGLGDPGQPVRPFDERVEHLVRTVSAERPALAALAPLVLGLMRRDPRRRISLSEAKERLDRCEEREHTEPPAPRTGPEPAPGSPARLAPGERDRLLTDGLSQLVAGMTPESESGLWPAPPLEGRQFDTLAVQAGSAGTLEVMRRSLPAGAEADRDLREALSTGLAWLDRRADREGRQLPGLYFGRAGTYWAMFEAARTLGDEEAGNRALVRAKRLPVVWDNPDITHGVAGNGLAQLHLWRRTGDEEFRLRAALCAESVLAAKAPDGLAWPIGQGAGTGKGLTHYGFAHGVAGIGAFLLSAGRELDRPDLMETALACGDFLLSLAREHGEGLSWPTAQSETPGGGRMDGVCWWCSGSPGIGTFLVRLWRATGDERFRVAAHRAAVSTRNEKWLMLASHCHGLAGNGEFLLDMAAATGDATYRDWAAEHATALHRLSALHHGRLVVLDESNAAMSYSYNVGMAGPIGFLHRLRHGGSRWWMVDDFALTPEGEDR